MKKKTLKQGTLRRTSGYLKPHKLLLIGSILCSLSYVPLSLIGPVFIGRAIDAAIGVGNVNFDTVLLNLLLLGGTTAISALLQWLMQVCTRKVSARISQTMRQEAFDRINKAPLKKIDTSPHGDLVSRLVNDADAVAEGLLQGLTQLFPGIITIVTTLILMFSLYIPIATVVIIITPLSILFANFVVKRTGGLFHKQSATQGDTSAYIGEMVTNQNLLRSFGAEAESEAEFAKINDRYYQAYFKATVYSSIINPGTRLLNALVYGAVGTFGAFLAVSGGITVGGVSAFLAYANQYSKPFNEISAVITQLQSAIAGAQRLFQVIDWEVEQPDQENAQTPLHASGMVEMKQVDFSYVPERPLIKNFNLSVQPGQRIALVGPTGCGKTTIINLLMRFYEIDHGVIQVDGIPITEMTRNSLRGLFGMVLQETWLKKATIRENIAYGRPEADETEVIAAAKAAYAHGFIKRLPDGYDTIIDAGGGNLSAGQKQLLCIARIMLTKPDILILDEATSSIDTRTEMLIQKALEQLMTGHTSFIVAHRLSTIENADVILVMKDGEIIEQGSHEQLLAKQGFYTNLYNSQFAVE